MANRGVIVGTPSINRNRSRKHDATLRHEFSGNCDIPTCDTDAIIDCAGNQILGEVELVGASNVEKTSGVWVDGQYVGYLKELKGAKKILLLPGEHEISVRQDGYQDFTQKITVRPGEKQTIAVKMVKDPRFRMPSVFSEIKLSVTPHRAAVFVDGLFVGHVGEFGGVAKSLLVAPGHRKITISLPGYQTFNTEVDLVPNQKFQIKTDLAKVGGAAPPVPQ